MPIERDLQTFLDKPDRNEDARELATMLKRYFEDLASRRQIGGAPPEPATSSAHGRNAGGSILRRNP